MRYHPPMQTGYCTIRQATAEDRNRLLEQLPGPGPEPETARRRLAAQIERHHVWLAAAGETIQAAVMLMLPEQAMLILHRRWTKALRDWMRSLINACERAAVAYGMLEITVSAEDELTELLREMGYRQARLSANPAGNGHRLQKSLRPRLGSVRRRILAQCAELGIPADYGIRHELPMQQEAGRLCHIGEDCFGRPRQATPSTARAWRRMLAAARKAGIELLLVSAYRSHRYQYDLVRRKLARGQSMEQILRVSSAPGFSEHHTGRALDLATPDSRPLEAEFAATPAYAWLKRHAGDFGFVESYPRDNRHGIAWEPWHWCYRRRY